MLKTLLLSISLISVINTNAQDSTNRINVEVDFKLVPVMRSLYSNYDFFKINREANIISHKNNRFRLSYSARINILSIDETCSYGIALKYSQLSEYGSKVRPDHYSGWHLMAENLKADYVGLNIRRLKLSKKFEKLMRGFTLGGGLIKGRSRYVTYMDSWNLSQSSTTKSLVSKYEFNSLQEVDLGYKVQLIDFYVNYSMQYPVKLTSKIDLLIGCEVPLLRLFSFNGSTRFGLSFNDESFFTSFESYIIEGGDQQSANKSFAYSMKKVNSFSLNFGLRYNL